MIETESIDEALVDEGFATDPYPTYRRLRPYRDIRFAPSSSVAWRANIAFRGLATFPVELECR